MTKGEAKAAALRWIDEATVNGRDPGAGELADYRDRMNYLLDGVLNTLAISFPLSGEQHIVHCPPANLLGTVSNVQQFTPPQVYSMQAAGAKSLYAEVYGTVQLCFADGRQKEISNSGQFEAVRVALEDDQPIVFKSDFPFSVRYPALYAQPCRTEAEIPSAAPYSAYALPTDFRALRRVIREWDGQNAAFSAYRCENGKQLLLPRDMHGVFTVHYDRRPQKTAYDAEDSAELDCLPIAEPLIPLRLAADVTLGTLDRAQTAYYLENRYTAMLLTLQTERADAQDRIESLYAID